MEAEILFQIIRISSLFTAVFCLPENNLSHDKLNYSIPRGGRILQSKTNNSTTVQPQQGQEISKETQEILKLSLELLKILHEQEEVNQHSQQQQQNQVEQHQYIGNHPILNQKQPKRLHSKQYQTLLYHHLLKHQEQQWRQSQQHQLLHNQQNKRQTLLYQQLLQQQQFLQPLLVKHQIQQPLKHPQQKLYVQQSKYHHQQQPQQLYLQRKLYQQLPQKQNKQYKQQVKGYYQQPKYQRLQDAAFLNSNYYFPYSLHQPYHSSEDRRKLYRFLTGSFKHPTTSFPLMKYFRNQQRLIHRFSGVDMRLNEGNSNEDRLWSRW